MINKKSVRLHFSKSARTYDTYAHIQKNMAHTLTSMLLGLAQQRKNTEVRILDLGCGTGFLTEILLKYFPHSQITAVDIAPGMINRMKEKFSHRKTISYWCGDIEDEEFKKIMARQEKYDIIVSNAAFQWINNLEYVMKTVVPKLNEKGIFGFSTFIAGTFEELHHVFRIASQKVGLEKEYVPGQVFQTKDDLLNLCLNFFAKGNYQSQFLEEMRKEQFPSVKDFLYSIKKIGANNSHERHCLHLSVVKEALRLYDELYRKEEKVVATYNCFYFMAWKN